MHHGFAEQIEQAGCFLGEPDVIARCLHSGEGLDGIGVRGVIVRQVERAAIRPEMARQKLFLDQGDTVFEGCARRSEQVVEHVAHGQNGRPGIHGTCLGRDCPHLSARPAMGIEEGHAQTGRLQPNGCGETAHARTDDHGAGGPVVRLAIIKHG